jgi:UDP-glucuronate 4-epimerase
LETILVTGGAGFIGSHLCERLIDDGHRVVCFDNFDPYYDPNRKRRNLAALERSERFHLVCGDIRDAPALQLLLRENRIDAIAHLAARVGVRSSLHSPVAYQDVNVSGSTTVLEAARGAGIGTVVMASSSSVYGSNVKSPFHEDDPVVEPISPYAASKRSMELVGRVYAHLYGMDVICLRFFTVYGPRQRPDMAISTFVERVRSGLPIEVFGDGSALRDYTYIGDIVNGFTAALYRAHGIGFQIANLGNSHTVALKDLICEIGRALDREPRVINRPTEPGDVNMTCADVRKAAELFGFQPVTPIWEGIRRYVEWVEMEDHAHVAA